MSQHDMTIANDSGANVRTDIQSMGQALASTAKGPSAPSTPYAGQLWIDDNTPSATVWTLSMYDGADWISLGTFDVTANTFTASAAAAPTNIVFGTSKVEVTSSGGNVDVTTGGTLRARFLSTGPVCLGGQTAAATGYTNTGDITMPTTGKIRAGNVPSWHVMFNGTGTVAIRGTSHNVSSITDNGVGDYTINLTNAVPSANYTVVGSSSDDGTNLGSVGIKSTVAPTTTACRVLVGYSSIPFDAAYVSVAGMGV